MFTVYAYGNGDVLAELFNGVALVFSGGTYESLFRLALMFLVIGVLVFAALRGRLLGNVLLGAFILLFLATSVTITVSVEDQVNPLNPPVVVANVPFIVGAPFAVGSTIEFHISRLLETALSVPGVYRATNSSYNRFLFDLQKILDVRLVHGDLNVNLKNFLAACVFPEIRNSNVTLDSYVNSLDLLSTLGGTLNPARFAAHSVGGNVIGALSCDEFYRRVIDPGFTIPSADYDEAMRRFRVALQADVALPGDELTHVTPITAMWGVGQGERALLNNVLITSAWVDSEQQDLVRLGNVAATVEMALKQVGQEVKFGSYVSGTIAQKFVPVIRTMAEGLIILLAPFLFVMAMHPAMGRLLGTYLKLFLWVHLWGPIYVVLNFVMFLAMENETTPLIDSLGGVVLQNFGSVREHVAMLNSVAADANWGVPILAWALVAGGGGLAEAVSASSRSVRETGGYVAHDVARGEGRVLEDGAAHRMELREVTQVVPGGGPTTRTLPVANGMEPGLRVDHQSGTQELRHNDGGVSRMGGPLGTIQYEGPGGHYTRNQHGEMVEGFAVSTRKLPGGGVQEERKEVVGGNQLLHTTTSTSPSGLTETVSTLLSGEGSLLKRDTVTRTDGAEEQREEFPDGSGAITGQRHGQVFIERGQDGKQRDLVDGFLTYHQPIHRNGEPGQLQGTFVGNDGVQMRLGGEIRHDDETGLPIFLSLGGEIGNVTDKRILTGRSLVATTTSPHSEGLFTKSSQAPVSIRDVAGNIDLKRGILVDQGFTRDGEHISTGAHFVNQDGDFEATGHMVPAQRIPDPSEVGGFKEVPGYMQAGRTKTDNTDTKKAVRNGIEFQTNVGPDGRGVAVAKGITEDTPIFRGGQQVGTFEKGTVNLIGAYDPKTDEVIPFEQGFAAMSKDGRFAGFVTDAAGGEGFDISQGTFDKVFDNKIAGPYGLPTEIKDVQTGVMGQVKAQGSDGSVTTALGDGIPYSMPEGDAIVGIQMGDRLFYEQARVSETGLARFNPGAQLGSPEAFEYEPSVTKLSFHDEATNAIAHFEGVRGQNGVVTLKAGDAQNYLNFKMSQAGLVSHSQVGQSGQVLAEDVKGGTQFEAVGPDGTRFQGVAPIGSSQVLGMAESIRSNLNLVDAQGRSLAQVESAKITSSGIFDRNDPNGTLQRVDTTIAATTPYGEVRGSVVPVEGAPNVYQFVSGKGSSETEFERRDPDSGLPMEITQSGGGVATYSVRGSTNMSIALAQEGKIVQGNGLLFERGQVSAPSGGSLLAASGIEKTPSLTSAQFRLQSENGNITTYNVKGRFESRDGDRVFIPETGDSSEFMRSLSQGHGFVRESFVSQGGAEVFTHGVQGKNFESFNQFLEHNRYSANVSAYSIGAGLFKDGQLNPEELTDGQRALIHDLGVAGFGVDVAISAMRFRNRITPGRGGRGGGGSSSVSSSGTGPGAVSGSSASPKSASSTWGEW